MSLTLAAAVAIAESVAMAVAAVTEVMSAIASSIAGPQRDKFNNTVDRMNDYINKLQSNNYSPPEMIRIADEAMKYTQGKVKEYSKQSDFEAHNIKKLNSELNWGMEEVQKAVKRAENKVSYKNQYLNYNKPTDLNKTTKNERNLYDDKPIVSQSTDIGSTNTTINNKQEN